MDLEQRVERLERENRRRKLVAAAVVAAVVTALTALLAWQAFRPPGSAAEGSGSRVVLVCRWWGPTTMSDRVVDSFVIDFDRSEVYSSEQDETYPLAEVTEGRLRFTIVRPELRMRGGIERDVELRYSINRVTGEMDIENRDLFLTEKRCVRAGSDFTL